jgi:hypothetical protein
MGQPDKARASYREFMSLWQDADARIPIFHEASLEFEQLGSGDNQELSAAARRPGQLERGFPQLA